MSALSVELDGPGIERVIAFCKEPMNQSGVFFKRLAAYFDGQTKLTFLQSGARAGHPEWDHLHQSTLTTAIGTQRLRYGTDQKPTRTPMELSAYRKEIKWGLGRAGFMRGYEGKRRYGPDSKPLQASGSFMRSFHAIASNSMGMVFGSNYHSITGSSAGEIAGKREVMFITPTDRDTIKQMFQDFFKEVWQS